ncbi:hypothetical protein SK128_001669, partial [Halocaridina rubra]
SDSQSSPLGYPPTPTTSVPSTPTVSEPQKVWSSDSQSQSLSLEEDESLGAKATKAAVLYVNVHKPNLKTDYPTVADRERQIRRIWKNLKDTEQKKMLIQTARENKKEYYKNKQFRSGRVIIPQGGCAREPSGSASPPLPPSPLSVGSSSTPQPPFSPPPCTSTSGQTSPLVPCLTPTCPLQPLSAESSSADALEQCSGLLQSSATMKVAGVQTSPPGSSSNSSSSSCGSSSSSSGSCSSSSSSGGSCGSGSSSTSIPSAPTTTSLNPLRPSLSRLTNSRSEPLLTTPSSSPDPDPDQHIRVLTPLEIMRTLPVLHQDALPSPTTTSVTTTTTTTTTYNYNNLLGQEQQRALKNAENLDGSNTPASSGTPGSLPDGANSDPSPVTTPQASPRPQLPSLTPPRPIMMSQRPQLPSGSPTMRPSVVHTMVRGPVGHLLGPSDPYAMQPGTPHPAMTPRPQTSPLPSPTSDPYARIPPSPRPPVSSDPYSIQPATPRPVTSDAYGMPPPTPRPIDPYATQVATPRPISSEQFTSSTETFSQPQASPYAQAPPTPRPHDDSGYGQPPSELTRQQQLRELLQRQQSRPWSEGLAVHQTSVPQPLASPEQSGEFRQPLPPVVQGQSVRMRPSLAPGQPGIITHPSVSAPGNHVDQRVRMILHRGIPGQQPGVIGRNPLDPFTHLAQQRPPQQYITSAGPSPVVRSGVPGVVRVPPGTVAVSQGTESPQVVQGGPVPVPHISPTHHQQPPHPLGPPHSQNNIPPVSHPVQLHQQPRPLSVQPPHLQQSRVTHIPQAPTQPSLPHQSESELPEAVTRELEQLEEEQQQQQHQQHSSAESESQRTSSTGSQLQHSTGNQGDDLEDLAPGDLPSMEDDILVGDFNALLEFADGEDGEEDDEKLPSNLFDDLEGDEDERQGFFFQIILIGF